jgi:hypothetical protein
VNDVIVDGSTGASGRVVKVAGSRVTFTQNTLNADFANGNTVLVGGVSQGTVNGAPSASGTIYMLRASSSIRYRKFSAQIDNFISSNSVYAGKDIYEVSPTADNASPASGPFLIYNTQASLDRTNATFNITGAIAVGNTITGATSGASAVVTSVGTFLVLYKPNNDIPWTVGENVQVGGVTQATALNNQPYPGYLADFSTPPSVIVWDGVYRFINAAGGAVRMRSDMTAAIVKDRFFLQTSEANSATSVGAIPSGTGTTSGFDAANNSDPTNASVMRAEVTASFVNVKAVRNGVGTFLPMVLGAGGNDSVRLDTNGSVRTGLPSLATTATDGFLYVPTCAGTPTGVPTSITGMAPIVVNTTNNKLYFYSSGVWRDAGP